MVCIYFVRIIIEKLQFILIITNIFYIEYNFYYFYFIIVYILFLNFIFAFILIIILYIINFF